MGEEERQFGVRGSHTGPGSVLHNGFMLVDARYKKGIEASRGSRGNSQPLISMNCSSERAIDLY